MQGPNAGIGGRRKVTCVVDGKGCTVRGGYPREGGLGGSEAGGGGNKSAD